MKETRAIMGMPVTVEVVDPVRNSPPTGPSGAQGAGGISNGVDGSNIQEAIDKVFDYFAYIDEKFSTFKSTSEITKINDGLLSPENFSEDMKKVFELSEKTKQETHGYFDIVNPVRGHKASMGTQAIHTSNGVNNEGKYDPSGLVKGWAIYNAAQILKNLGFKHFYVEAGGDIQVQGKNNQHNFWNVGIKNPFRKTEIVKVVYLKNNEGIATSGIYERGNHIYNPKNRKQVFADIISLTVIGPNIYEADRFATAAFAMQKKGIGFIERVKGFEGYMIDSKGIATMTSHFKQYTKP